MQSVYLDNAATSFPKAPGVGEAMARAVERLGANPGRGAHPAALEAGRAVMETRRALAKLLGFSGPESHVILTPGATFGLNLLLAGVLKPGDHVLVSAMEHNAVMRPLTALSERGVCFDRIPPPAERRQIAALLRKNTRLILVCHASNVSGLLFPLEECARLCQEKGLPLAVDAAQTAGSRPISFDGLGLAALCVPGHKGLLGPQGTGALLLSPSFAPAVGPLVRGGTGSLSQFESQPEQLPDRLESGTLNLPGICGLRAALAYVQTRGPQALGDWEDALTARFLAALDGLPLRVAGGRQARRVGVVSLDFPGRDNAEIAFRLEREYGIVTRCGLHCAPAAHRAAGTYPQGTVRFSPGPFTTESQIDAAAAAVKAILEE